MPAGFRNRHNKGKWLVVDDESGFIEYSDKVVKRWDGVIVRKDQDEPIHPQYFIKAKGDPYPVPYVRPDSDSGLTCSTIGPFYPNTTTRRLVGAASHLKVADKIGDMEIECSFTVFPD